MNYVKSYMGCFHNGTLQSTAIIVLIVLFGSTVSYAQSTEYVVFSIKGTIEKLHLGQVLKEGDLIELPAESEVSLLSKAGDFTQLEGPLVARVTNESSDERGEGALTKLANLLFDEEKFVPIVGATRSLNGQADINTLLLNQDALNPWSPVLSQFDTYCLNMDQPVLSRTSAGDEITVVLTSGTAKNDEITWAAGSQSLHLNEYIDPAHNDVTVFLSDRLEPITIQFLEIGENTFIEQAAWMVEQNCQYQALQLLAKGE
jgi:hypothetical protein